MPSAMDCDGKSILVNAAIEPLIADNKIAARQRSNTALTFGAAFRQIRLPPLADHAVNERNATKINVFIKWPIVQSGRVGVQLAAVLPVKTSPPPIAPSTIIKNKENSANFHSFSFAGYRLRTQFRIAQTARTKTTIPAKAVVNR